MWCCGDGDGGGAITSCGVALISFSPGSVVLRKSNGPLDPGFRQIRSYFWNPGQRNHYDVMLSDFYFWNSVGDPYTL